METFSALLAICAGNSPVSGVFPAQRPVTRSFDVIFDLRLNKRLSKQWWDWWFETLSGPLWRNCYVQNGFVDTFCANYKEKEWARIRGIYVLNKLSKPQVLVLETSDLAFFAKRLESLEKLTQPALQTFETIVLCNRLDNVFCRFSLNT